RPVPRPRHPAAELPVAGRLARRAHCRAQGRAGQQHQRLPVPHHPQLHADVPQGPEPGQGHCGDQEDDVAL
ncbi:hypothetical protein KEM52_001818, partial [Ascosphaera acerosa]